MASKAEAVAIIIDVGPSMNEAPEGEETPLQKCIAAANMIVQRKIFTDTKKAKDEVVLLLFGTAGTENELHEENGGGYEYITVVKELGVMDLEILKFINQQITPGMQSGDFVDALVVALDHLHKKCKGRKMDQKIVLFSNLCHEFNGDDLDNIIGGMKSNNVNMIFVGPEVNDDDDNDDDNVNGHTADRGNTEKPLTTQQRAGVNCIGHLLREIDGDGISLNEVLPMLSYFETRRKKQVTTFRGPIELGNNLKINVYAYVKVKEERPSSWKKLSALAEHAANRDTMAVEMQRSFHLNDEDQTEVDKENTAQAYRYGKTLVPMTSDDQKSMKLQTTKGCLVLGFTSRENVPRHLYTRDTCHIFTSQPDDQHAAIAFSALCHALEEKNMVAIVRYVSRGNTDPKIGFLSPHIKSSYESLIFIALPYREDIRTYMFGSLEGGKNKAPSGEQLSAVDSLIDSMLLVEKSLDEDDEEVEQEMYKPKNILNPVNQRQCQCIQSRALNPDENNIPDIEEYIARSIRAKAVMVEGCEATYKKIKECFPLEQVETKKKSASSMFDKNDEEPNSKKPRGEETSDDINFGSLTKDQVTEVGLVDPLEDFKTLLEGANNRDKNLEFLEQMSNVVVKLVKESFLDQHYAKALECMKALREQCVKLKICTIFNELLLKLKEEMYGKRRQDFYDLLADGSFNPISSVEVGDSKFSEEQSRNFFDSDEEKKPTVAETPASEEDADDLLDML